MDTCSTAKPSNQVIIFMSKVLNIQVVAELTQRDLNLLRKTELGSAQTFRVLLSGEFEEKFDLCQPQHR